MKKDKRNIYRAIILAWGILACLAAAIFAMRFDGSVELTNSSFWNIAYGSVFAMLIIALVTSLGFALFLLGKGLIESPKTQLPRLIGFGVLVVVFLVSWSLSSGTDVPEAVFERVNTDYGLSKIIGGAFYMLYVLILCSILSVIGSELLKRGR